MQEASKGDSTPSLLICEKMGEVKKGLEKVR